MFESCVRVSTDSIMLFDTPLAMIESFGLSMESFSDVSSEVTCLGSPSPVVWHSIVHDRVNCCVHGTLFSCLHNSHLSCVSISGCPPSNPEKGEGQRVTALGLGSRVSLELLE